MIPTHELKRLKESSVRMGIVKLIRQLSITEGRIRDEFALVNDAPEYSGEILTLDLETYYTVAFDLLTLASRLLPPAKQRSLKASPTFKRIAILRNQRTRHAYNKPDGIHDGGLNWNTTTGPSLNTIAHHRIDDPGFFVNQPDLDDLIVEYDITDLYAYPPLVALTDAVRKGKIRVRF